MRFVTLADAQDDLQRLADQVGKANFPKAKALYLQGVALVDEEGSPLGAEAVDVIIMPAGGTEDAMDEEMPEDEAAKSEDVKTDPEAEAKSVIAARRKAVGGWTRSAAPTPVRKVYGRVKNFTDGGKYEAVEKAYRFGRAFCAMMGNRKSLDWCERNGLEIKAHTEGSNAAGGYLVPEEFENDLIVLREQYGVFRPNCTVRPMTRDTLRIPRWKSGLTAYFVGETSAITDSTQTFESVLLVAKKLGAITVISNELNEDAMVNIGDQVAGEISFALAQREDECGFVGDGTSTYGGIQGVGYVLQNGTANVQYLEAGLSALTDLTMDDLHTAMAAIPQYADTPNTAWYMHKTFWHGAVEPLIFASNGTTTTEVVNGVRTPMLFGYPVRFTQVMPSAIAADTTMAFFGDLSLAATFGDRREVTIGQATEGTVAGVNLFEQDALAIKGTQRFDINVHDTGSSTETGPVFAIRA
jgi:HK97 family phage major capsid protein